MLAASTAPARAFTAKDTMKTDHELLSAFAPTGALRASINLGNPILANADPVTGQAGGVSVDLATELARRLDVELELVVFKSAGESVNAVAGQLFKVRKGP